MTPVYPAYDVQVATDHEEAFIKNCIAVRLTTLVPHEFWDEFKARLGIKDELLAPPQKGITSGRP